MSDLIKNARSYQYRLTRVFLVVWGTMFPQYNPQNQNKFPVGSGMSEYIMLEWVGGGNSTMLLLHMRQQNEANSHNKLLNCKNQVLQSKSEYHNCVRNLTIIVVIMGRFLLML